MPPTEISQLEAWLAKTEATFTDIKPDNAKAIVWDSRYIGQKAPWAVVYIHGFSASRLETAPLADEVAKALGGHLFYTRLAGHGRSGEQAMAEATAQDWLADTQEAIQIGQRLGQRVLVISCSTGSTLATWLETLPIKSAVSGHVFISPNFGPKDKRSELINGPWGQQIALGLEGKMRGRTSKSAADASAWTSRYPTRALFPMMALVQEVRTRDLGNFTTPLLVLYSEADQTVDPTRTREAFARIGSPVKTLESVAYSKSEGQHVLAGAIRDPQAVAPMAQRIVSWTKTLP